MDKPQLILGHVHTAPAEFEHEAFTLKTHQMFFVDATPEEYENMSRIER